jgi:GNAT superfamily N-acetyltransferase
MAGGTQLRLATPNDITRLAEVLALAFDNDPVTRWHVPDDARRVPVMQRFFEFALRSIFLPLGAVWTTVDLLGGAAWMPDQAAEAQPGADDPPDSAIGQIFGKDAWMVNTILRVQQAHQPAERHHYLQFMGTHPEQQGHGIGAALMEAGLAWCDADSLPAYLDASSPASRDFYKHHGFSVVDTFNVPNGPRFWQMRRIPSGGRTGGGATGTKATSSERGEPSGTAVTRTL